MHSHRNQFIAFPPDIADVLAGGSLHVLAELERGIALEVAIGGPRERRRFAEASNVRNLETEVHVAPPFLA